MDEKLCCRCRLPVVTENKPALFFDTNGKKIIKYEHMVMEHCTLALSGYNYACSTLLKSALEIIDKQNKINSLDAK